MAFMFKFRPIHFFERMRDPICGLHGPQSTYDWIMPEHQILLRNFLDEHTLPGSALCYNSNATMPVTYPTTNIASPLQKHDSNSDLP